MERADLHICALNDFLIPSEDLHVWTSHQLIWHQQRENSHISQAIPFRAELHILWNDMVEWPDPNLYDSFVFSNVTCHVSTHWPMNPSGGLKPEAFLSTCPLEVLSLGLSAYSQDGPSGYGKTHIWWHFSVLLHVKKKSPKKKISTTKRRFLPFPAVVGLLEQAEHHLPGRGSLSRSIGPFQSPALLK